MFRAIILSVVCTVFGHEQPDCLLTGLDSIAVFQRPDSCAAVWSMLEAFESVVLSGRTVDGWLGFDPGVAQAANIGSFRLRWIPDGEKFVIEGELDSVPIVWGPAADITYAMIYQDSPLFAEPDSLSMVIDSIPFGSAAGIILRTEDWYLLDLNESPLENSAQGWISSLSVSVSGNLDTIPLQ
ncbi:MAG: hypothetical protein K8R76_03035 [Candidatus Aegiribacteria sp.]|nr:hypothetical protein [Candidatus Aegiribacteria sp.]